MSASKRVLVLENDVPTRLLLEAVIHSIDQDIAIDDHERAGGYALVIYGEGFGDKSGLRLRSPAPQARLVRMSSDEIASMDLRDCRKLIAQRLGVDLTS